MYIHKKNFEKKRNLYKNIQTFQKINLSIIRLMEQR